MNRKIDTLTSYTAANTIPLKVLLDGDLLRAVKRGRILPLHIQFIPTNKCNLHCSFCSCSERDEDLEMRLEDAEEIIHICMLLGTKAVTITGGGEPLCYPSFDELIRYFRIKHIKIGLVTNGLLLHKMKVETLRKLTWCRISSGDDRTLDGRYKEGLDKVVTECPNVGWAFSHVVSTQPNLGCIRQIVRFANEHRFTHVRLVADLFQPEFMDMENIRIGLKGMDDSLVIYQGRKQYTKGGDCYICYLKPVIGPDLRVYTCCGAQYALEMPTRDMPSELSLGMAKSLRELIAQSSRPFNGSKCIKCYYSNYNDLLGRLLKEIEHKEFV